jgi:hypothetical protein
LLIEGHGFPWREDFLSGLPACFCLHGAQAGHAASGEHPKFTVEQREMGMSYFANHHRREAIKVWQQAAQTVDPEAKRILQGIRAELGGTCRTHGMARA